MSSVSLVATLSEKISSKLEVKTSFPVTYIVSGKDNLTVLTTVNNQEEWKEYVKNNKIKNVYMDLRGISGLG